MKKTRFNFLFLVLILLLPVSLGAVDFGLLTNQYMGLSNDGGDDNNFEYSGSLIPRLSVLFGETGLFYTSGAFTIGYADEAYFVPELLRTELSIRFGGFGIRAGRFNYTDPLSFIASGLFDGIQFSHTSRFGRFGLGAWYTGLQYKKAAKIRMTQEDERIYTSALDYNKFSDTYFAPRRMMAALNWEHPALVGGLGIKTAVIGQMDFSDVHEKLNSQYFTLKFDIPVSNFVFELGGAFGVTQYRPPPIIPEGMEIEEVPEELIIYPDYSSHFSFAGRFGFYYTLPTNFSSMVSFVVNHGSGYINDDIGGFTPITTRYFGNILEVELPGLTAFSLDFAGRFHRTFGANATLSYFILNSLKTPNVLLPAEESNNNRLLGGEMFIRFVWSPVSDLQLTFAAGTFVPAWGNVFQEGKPHWRLDLTAVLAIY